MLCSKLHYQKSSELKHISYEIRFAPSSRGRIIPTLFQSLDLHNVYTKRLHTASIAVVLKTTRFQSLGAKGYLQHLSHSKKNPT